MKKLILISALLFSFNSIAEKENPFDAWDEDFESSEPISREYNQQIECFSNGKKIIDIDDVYVRSYDRLSISYYTKNGW